MQNKNAETNTLIEARSFLLQGQTKKKNNLKRKYKQQKEESKASNKALMEKLQDTKNKLDEAGWRNISNRKYDTIQLPFVGMNFCVAVLT